MKDKRQVQQWVSSGMGRIRQNISSFAVHVVQRNHARRDTSPWSGGHFTVIQRARMTETIIS